MDIRYIKNIPAISPDEQEALQEKRVLLLGCGGLGGYISEYLLRVGVGEIRALDGDSFEDSNLNRQILCGCSNIGQSKVAALKERAALVNPSVVFTGIEEDFCKANAASALDSVDIVLDGLDNAESRLLLEDECASRGLSIVHGAIEGWSAQIGVSTAGCGLLHKIYEKREHASASSALAFAAACCAAVQVAEAVKLLTGRSSELENKLLVFSLESLEADIISFE